MDESHNALVPRFDSALGRYVWEAPAEESLPAPSIEPAFIKQAVEADFDQVVTNDFERHDVTTLGDFAPGIPVADVPTMEADFDPLADWRVPGEVADDILISLPEGTPRMLRALLTLLLGGMRHGGSEHS